VYKRLYKWVRRAICRSYHFLPQCVARSDGVQGVDSRGEGVKAPGDGLTPAARPRSAGGGGLRAGRHTAHDQESQD